MSCFMDYLMQIVEKYPTVRTIILWTDGCTYQNRNSMLASAIANFCAKHEVTVYQKYLEVGHTHMECDSVHKNVETAKKSAQGVGGINLPTDYINLIRTARKTGGDYGVKYCDYTFFKDFTSSGIKSIKPSKEKGAPYVVDIRQIKYTEAGSVLTNLTYDDISWKEIPFKVTINKNSKPKQTRDEPIPISSAKWTHLQEICNQSLSKDFHPYYNNLAHRAKPVSSKPKTGAKKQ